MQAAKAAGAVTSFDLNYRAKLWNISGGEQRAVEVLDRIVRNVDVLVGNEEDLQKGLGIPGQDVHAASKLDPSAFFGMIDQVTKKHPHVKVVATTLREVHSTNRHSWSAVAWINGKTYNAPTAELDVYDRVGGGDGFASGFFYGLLIRRVGGGSGEARLGARRAADDIPGRHHHGHARPGAVVRQGRLRQDPALMDIQAQAAKIKLLLMDVDGVLTNGKLYNVPDPEGKMVETKGFDSQDGIGLQWLSWHGVKTGVISGRLSPATQERARQMKMSYVYQGHIEKIPILEEILADAKIDSSEVAYIGDDFTDITIMHRVGSGDRHRERARRGEARGALRHAGGRRRWRGARSRRVAAESAGPLAEDFEALRDRRKRRQSQLRMTFPEQPDIIASKPFSNSV